MLKKLSEGLVPQFIKKLADIDLQYPAPLRLTIHRLVAKRRKRLVRRSTWPEAVRTVQKIVFINRFQQHDDRPLEELVLQSGNS